VGRFLGHGTVYMMNSIGPRTEPCGTPHIRATIVDLASHVVRTVTGRPGKTETTGERRRRYRSLLSSVVGGYRGSLCQRLPSDPGGSGQPEVPELNF